MCVRVLLCASPLEFACFLVRTCVLVCVCACMFECACVCMLCVYASKCIVV